MANGIGAVSGKLLNMKHFVRGNPYKGAVLPVKIKSLPSRVAWFILQGFRGQ